MVVMMLGMNDVGMCCDMENDFVRKDFYVVRTDIVM